MRRQHLQPTTVKFPFIDDITNIRVSANYCIILAFSFEWQCNATIHKEKGRSIMLLGLKMSFIRNRIDNIVMRNILDIFNRFYRSIKNTVRMLSQKLSVSQCVQLDFLFSTCSGCCRLMVVLFNIRLSLIKQTCVQRHTCIVLLNRLGISTIT